MPSQRKAAAEVPLSAAPIVRRPALPLGAASKCKRLWPALEFTNRPDRSGFTTGRARRLPRPERHS
jgi:hypothetical protein